MVYCAGALPPYPVAIFTGGFLVSSSSYLSYAERLASWGYVTVLYDKGKYWGPARVSCFSCTCCQLSSLCSSSLQCHIKVLPPAAESAVDNLDDIISMKFIQEIIDWCGSHPVISRVSDTSRVYLCGHSRVRRHICRLLMFQAASGCMYCDHWALT